MFNILVEEKYVIDPENISKHSAGNLKEVPYYFMILSNLTVSEEGQKKFFNSDDEKIKGIVFLKILDKFFQYAYHEEFNFCSNLIANITSLKEGRTFLLDLKLFKVILYHFDKLNNFKVINMLRIIRNCCFEFETHKEDILMKDAVLFSYLIKIFVLTNIKEKKELQTLGIAHIDEIYFTHFSHELAQDNKDTITDLIIDIFLVLTNVEEAVEHMKKKDLYKAITELSHRLPNDTHLRDRLFVINNYLEN